MLTCCMKVSQKSICFGKCGKIFNQIFHLRMFFCLQCVVWLILILTVMPRIGVRLYKSAIWLAEGGHSLPGVCTHFRKVCVGAIPLTSSRGSSEQNVYTHIHTYFQFVWPCGPIQEKARGTSGGCFELIAMEIGVGSTILGPTSILGLPLLVFSRWCDPSK